MTDSKAVRFHVSSSCQCTFNILYYRISIVLDTAYISTLLSPTLVVTCHKGQRNLAKVDIARLIMTSNTAHSCLVNYHIRQVAARVAKLVPGCVWGPILGKGKS